MKMPPPFRASGFLLLELAIALTILGLFVGTGAGLLRNQIENRKRAETLAYLDEVRNALLVYFQVHGNFPGADGDGDGREDRTGDASVRTTGSLPFRDIGVQPGDAWGRSLRYAVNLPMTYENNISLICENYFPLFLFSKTYNISHASHGPRASDAYGGRDRMNVVAVIVSSGASDADKDRSLLDSDWVSTPFGSNKSTASSSIPFLRAPLSETFDDLMEYIPYSLAYDWASSCPD